MDDYSGKKTGDRLVVSRKGSSLVLRETADNRDHNAQYCNRIGCNGIRNSTIGTQISCSGKAKSSRPSFRPSSSGKEIVGTSSRARSTINNQRKPLSEPRRKLSSQLETDSSESGSTQEDAEVSDIVAPIGKIQRRLHSESDTAGASEVVSTKAGSSSIGTSTNSRRTVYKRSGLGDQDVLVGSSTPLTSRSTSPGIRANASRYGLRSLRCNATSDVANSGSSPDANQSRRKGMARKRICDGESSSSARGKKMGGSSLEWQNSSLSSGISISDSRRARSGPSNRDNGASSVRTRRAISGYPRARANVQGNENNISLTTSTHVIPEMSQSDDPVDFNAHPSSYQSSLETSLSRTSSYYRPGGSRSESLRGIRQSSLETSLTRTSSYYRPGGSRSESLRGIRPSSPVEVGNNRPIINQENFQRYNMDGIAEVLLALERIEQDEELSYEQLLVLETNLFLNGLNFYDQHREMRLDIDNMSYEELLALEDRMGTVSTALTEEALSECLKTGVYQSASLENSNSDFCCDKDDVKCSICQEEYAGGDEVGRLLCEHMYHVVCIQQWLRLKNWCPICKVSAALPLSRSSTKLT